MAKREDTIPKKIGPWRREDYDSFLALDVELRPASRNQFSQLAGVPPNALPPDQQQVDKAWKARRSHPVYKQLQEDENFRAAWRLFKAAKSGLLTSPTAPLVFLREIVRFAGEAHRARGWTPQPNDGAFAKRQESAINYAEKLCALLDAGVHLDEYADTERLRTLLLKLPNAKRRKPYSDKRKAVRAVLTSFAFIMLWHFELKSKLPEIVTEFASMVGIDCDLRGAQRYCKEAKRLHEKALIAIAARSQYAAIPAG